jgi:hypothetical protein
MKKEKIIKGWAVFTLQDELCYTSAPYILGGGKIYQIYKTKKDAVDFTKIPMDSKYKIVKVEIKKLKQ